LLFEWFILSGFTDMNRSMLPITAKRIWPGTPKKLKLARAGKRGMGIFQ